MAKIFICACFVITASVGFSQGISVHDFFTSDTLHPKFLNQVFPNIKTLPTLPTPRILLTPRTPSLDFEVQHYDLDLFADPVKGSIQGTADLMIKSNSDSLKEVRLDAIGFQITKVTHGNQTLNVDIKETFLIIRLDAPLTKDQTAKISITYTATNPQVFYSAGPDASNPLRSNSAYTYTEPEGSRKWFPCVDRPDSKATLSMQIAVPHGFNALSNGLLVKEEDSTFHYVMRYPIAPYLISLAIGKFQRIKLGSFHDKAVSIWAPDDIMPAMVFDTRRTIKMMEVFSRFTGVLYPFGSYTQSVAQGYAGSMEHQSSTTMGGRRINGDGLDEYVVAHELAHQWFGDYVTCEHWGELWMNEGFATYLPFIFALSQGESDEALLENASWRVDYFTQAKTFVHPLSDSGDLNYDIFDSHTYDKGSLVLHFIHRLVNEKFGEQAFTSILHTYLERHGGKNVTHRSLQKVLEEFTGESWNDFFEQWVRSAGHPIVNASYRKMNGDIILTLQQEQALRREKTWRTFQFPLEIELITQDRQGDVHRKVRTIEVERATQEFHLETSGEEVLGINLDPRWLVPGEVTLEQEALGWLSILRHSPHPQSRIEAMESGIHQNHDVVTREMLELIRGDTSISVQLEFFDAASKDKTNVNAMREIYETVRKRVALSSGMRGILARARSWLVQHQETPPTMADELQWQNEYQTTPYVSERVTLLEMLKFASLERAHVFAIKRLKERRWTDRDREALLQLLTEHPTKESTAFMAQALQTHLAELPGTTFFQGLIKAKYNQPTLVPHLINYAKKERLYNLKLLALEVLLDQKSSADQICPELETILEATPAATDPHRHQEIAAEVAKIEETLGCD